MNEVFLTVFNMGISASFIIPVVLILRFLLKNAPKWVSVCLWAIVGIRLICPFSIESIFSLIPSAETVSPQIMVDKTPQINTGIPIINSTINPIIENSVSDVGAGNENILQKIIPILSVIWMAGVFLMIVYMAVSYIRIKNKVRDAVLYRNNIFQSENVSSPFVLGIIKPKIYLPFNISDENAHYVISHEIAHIKRKDHLWKPLGYFLLSFHWYNPLMWIAYIMLSKDIELACDEKVVKDFSTDEKANYSEALLNLSISRKTIAACPLAFGEVNVKNRVKSVLTYKKPAFWIIIVAIVSVIAVGVCFLTNPENNNENNNGFNASFAGSDLDGVVLEYETSLFDSENFYISLKWVNNSNHKICFGNDFKIYKGDTEYLPMVENYFNAILNLLESGKTIEQKQDLTSYAFENGVTYTLVKEFYIEGKSDKKYKAYVDFSFNVNYSFTNKHYVAENIFYESEGYKLEFGDPCISSVVYIDNPSPEFKISGNSLTLYEYADYSPEWTEFGNLKRIYLNEFNFDSLFQNNCKKSDLTPEVIRKNNKMAFYVVDDFSIHYLTIQNNDDIYIFENFPNNSYFRW